jgi:ElaB/YqjD/DUF883 family membrane-anchored ribosome-binding protein
MNSPMTESVADHADAMVDTATRSTARAADGAASAVQQSLGVLASGVETMRLRAAPALHGLAASTQDLARSSVDAVRARALRARDTGANFVRDHPMQALVFAAATGAALVLLGSVVTRRARFGARR